MAAPIQQPKSLEFWVWYYHRFDSFRFVWKSGTPQLQRILIHFPILWRAIQCTIPHVSPNNWTAWTSTHIISSRFFKHRSYHINRPWTSHEIPHVSWLNRRSPTKVRLSSDYGGALAQTAAQALNAGYHEQMIVKWSSKLSIQWVFILLDNDGYLMSRWWWVFINLSYWI
jgi:hypothetical protein